MLVSMGFTGVSKRGNGVDISEDSRVFLAGLSGVSGRLSECFIICRIGFLKGFQGVLIEFPRSFRESFISSKRVPGVSDHSGEEMRTEEFWRDLSALCGFQECPKKLSEKY